MTLEFPTPRQTLSYLTDLLGSRRIRPNNRLGQNLLIDLNLLELVVQSANLGQDDLILEVGCGTGSLTSRLVAESGFVVGVEIDFSMSELVREIVGNRENFLLIKGDILAGKNKIQDDILSQLKKQKTSRGLRSFKLVANLPYAVATPVIANLLLQDFPVDLMTVMVQWEIAQKMVSQPGGEEFGALSVLVQSLGRVEIIRKIPPTAFWPKPKVDSAIIRIFPNNKPLKVDNDIRELSPIGFRNFLRDLYSHRRKNLRTALYSIPGKNWAKSDVDKLLTECGIPGDIRAETLDPSTHLKLFSWVELAACPAGGANPGQSAIP